MKGGVHPPGLEWDPESAGLLHEDGYFICGYPTDEHGKCERRVGDTWRPCWQHIGDTNVN